MKTLVLANQKGGVGKSAVATQLAHYLYRCGLSVAVIDLDHQQNTSRPLRAHPDVTTAPFTASAIFEAAHAPALPTGRFIVVGGDDRLSFLERQPQQHNAYVTQFRTVLKASSGFHICIIDTNPNPDIRYAAALINADYVLAPIQLNQEAIGGIKALIGHPRYGIDRIKATLNPTLTFLGILPNQVEATPFQRANLHLLAKAYGHLLLARTDGEDRAFGYIQKRTAIAEAQAANAFVSDLAKTSARDTWRELKPVFDMIRDAMDLAVAEIEA